METLVQNRTEARASSRAALALPRNSSENLRLRLWINEKYATAELLTTGPELNDLARELILDLWLKTLLEIGEERFEAALSQVMETSGFRPHIAEIRRAAGVNCGIVDPVEEEAKAQLRYLLEGMRGPHGLELKPILGKVMYGTEKDPRDKDGMRDPTPERHPSTPFPMPERIEAALVKLGWGKLAAGIDVIAEHPSLSRKKDSDGDEYQMNRIRMADEVLKRFVAAYREV